MTPENTDVLARMRSKFFVKDTDPVGLRGLSIARAETKAMEKDRTVEIVATTIDTDLDEEVVLPSGIDWSYFNSFNQKKVFLDHYYSFDHCVGVARTVDPWMENGSQTGWKMRVHVYTGLKCPYADDLCAKIDQGGFGLSIGFIPMEIGDPKPEELKMWPGCERVIRRAKALEVSFTGLPANMHCQTVSGVSTEKKVDPKRLLIPRKQIVV